MGTIGVHGSPETQVVSGTITANQGTPASTSNRWPVQITDGTNLATVRDTGSNDSLNVAVVDASGNQITTFGGGGTEYTEGDVDATITGSAFLMEAAANTLQPVQGTIADGLLVNLGANNDVSIAGTVQVDVTDEAARDLGKVDVASLDQYTPVSGRLPVDGSGVTQPVSGTVADDGITPSSPVMIGGSVKNFDGTDPGNVSAEDDVARVILDNNRRVYVNIAHPNLWSFHSNGSTALTDQEVKADPGDGFSIFVTDIVFSSVNLVNSINLFFEEGATTVLGPFYHDDVNSHVTSLHFITPKKITASTALTCTTSNNVTHSIDVTGFVAKV